MLSTVRSSGVQAYFLQTISQSFGMNPVAVTSWRVCCYFHRRPEPVTQIANVSHDLVSLGDIHFEVHPLTAPSHVNMAGRLSVDWATPSCLATRDCEKPYINKSAACPLSLSGSHGILRRHVSKQILIE